MDPLADVFDLSRVSGAVMAQLIAREPWGLAVDPLPGAVFHAVMAGSCWLRIPGRAPQHLMPGDVVLLPTNTPHELVSSIDAPTESLARFEKDTRRTADGDVIIQGPGAATRVLCAAYNYDHEIAHPLMSQLPPVLYVQAGMPGDDGGVAATLRLLALELGGRPYGSRAAVGRLIDVMLIHVMRAWLRMQAECPPNALHIHPDHPRALSLAAEGRHREAGQIAHRSVVPLGDRAPDRLPQLVQVDPVAGTLEALALDTLLQCLRLGCPEEVAVEEQLEDPPVLLRLGDGRGQGLAEVALIGPAHLVERRKGVEDLGSADGDALGAEVLEEGEQAARCGGHRLAP